MPFESRVLTAAALRPIVATSRCALSLVRRAGERRVAELQRCERSAHPGALDAHGDHPQPVQRA